MTLAAGYLALSILVTILLFVIGEHTIRKTFEANYIKKLLILISGLLGWNIYIWLMANSGLIADFSFPPKFFLTLILPAFIFTGAFIYTNRNKQWIQNIPTQWLVYVQTYRIAIEVLFVYSVTASILPPQVTIEGYNFDMIFASSAPVIALLVFQFNQLPLKAILYWNYAGLLIILSIIILFLTSIYAPHLYPESPYISLKFTSYPFVLVAGYLMPAAVFIHVLSIVQLTKR
ncbi:hypothetical protein [Fulvivirga lutea]|uniref:Uncharacterized protein n=1 Tax=Fulvivirga lutea TaxID=2810512 RepID=A0A974WFB1_9BACT|nr:hypothetical protein [Fulvivirga lutea]QSE95957.1 hypothetical protein JR347_10020 [Fulvivirga lutea]